MSFFHVNGQNLFYEDSGGSGPVLMFFHGFMFDQSMFNAQVEYLKADYRCIRVDARSLGQTEWDGKAFDLYDVVSDYIGLMDHLGIDKPTIIGLSQGAYAALRLAIKHPERVRAMVLISTRKDMSSEEFNQNFKTLRDAWVEQGPQDFLTTPLMTLLIGKQELYSEHWDLWLPRWKQVSGERMYHGMNALLAREVLTDEETSAVTIPILSVHGIDDIGTPLGLANQLYDLFPNGKGKVRVEGAAHAVSMTHPDQVNAPIKAFLDEYAV